MNALAQIHVAKKALGLDDDTYRDLLTRETGKASAKDMTEAERRRVVEALNRAGFDPSNRVSNPLRKPLTGPYAKKLQGLWIAGWNLGLIRHRDDAALVAFVKRQTGLDAVRFLHDAADAKKAIEALKAWLARDGGVHWGSFTSLGNEWRAANGARIAEAQFNQLVKAGAIEPRAGLRSAVFEITGRPVETLTDNDWITVMNTLGAKVRALKASAS